MFKAFSLFRQAARHAVGWALPPTCISCRAPLPPAEPGGFCAACYAQLPWWNTSRILPPQLPRTITGFAAPCLYQGPMRQAILNLKFHDAPHTARHLAKLLLPHLPKPVPGQPLPLLVPIPSHASRLRWRTYNHAALLAQALAQLSGYPVNIHALTRTLKSPPQARQTRAARLRLPGTAFHATPQFLTNRSIVLIDDILTTGATAHATAIALKRVKSKEIHILTLAYTAPD